MGLLLASQSIGDLVSTPIAGALYEIDYDFMPLILYVSAILFATMLFVDLASKSQSTVQVSNPFDFDHRQLSFHALEEMSGKVSTEGPSDDDTGSRSSNKNDMHFLSRQQSIKTEPRFHFSLISHISSFSSKTLLSSTKQEQTTAVTYEESSENELF